MNRPSDTIRDAAPCEARFTVAEFIAISESGALDRFGKSELLDGRIIVVNSQTVWHMRAKLAMLFALREVVSHAGPTCEVGAEGSVTFEPADMPEPDVFLWDAADAEKWVRGDQVKLVVEVAASTERHDLGVKRRRYAICGVPEYWVVVERTRRFERFSDPADGDYRVHDGFAFDDGIVSSTLPGIAVPPGALR